MKPVRIPARSMLERQLERLYSKRRRLKVPSQGLMVGASDLIIRKLCPSGKFVRARGIGRHMVWLMYFRGQRELEKGISAEGTVMVLDKMLKEFPDFAARNVKTQNSVLCKNLSKVEPKIQEELQALKAAIAANPRTAKEMIPITADLLGLAALIHEDALVRELGEEGARKFMGELFAAKEYFAQKYLERN
ncbi:Uncharacterised protein [uncultured archaeon]|nr:Uncharacterised protein [uncultured archaeon]